MLPSESSWEVNVMNVPHAMAGYQLGYMRTSVVEVEGMSLVLWHAIYGRVSAGVHKDFGRGGGRNDWFFVHRRFSLGRFQEGVVPQVVQDSVECPVLRHLWVKRHGEKGGG